MLSRVADALYWMNRYIERAENVARVLDVHLHLVLDLPGGTTVPWDALVWATGDHASFQERFGTATKDSVVAFLTFDADNPSSMISCLRAAHENARSVRESITAEMWEQVNKFYLMVRTAASAGGILEAPHSLCTEIKLASHLYAGITDATLSYGEGWHFGRLGRLLERADMTVRLLDVKYVILRPTATDGSTPSEDLQWSAVLKSVSALEMYRQCYGRITPVQVAAFLVLNREFPRAMHACVVQAEASLHAISGSPMGTFENAAEQRLGRLRSELDYAQIQDIISGGLHTFLNAFQAHPNDAGDAIFDTFFASRPM
jgi:uncharacterized alpha-E superfamily protein